MKLRRPKFGRGNVDVPDPGKPPGGGGSKWGPSLSDMAGALGRHKVKVGGLGAAGVVGVGIGLGSVKKPEDSKNNSKDGGSDGGDSGNFLTRLVEPIKTAVETRVPTLESVLSFFRLLVFVVFIVLVVIGIMYGVFWMYRAYNLMPSFSNPRKQNVQRRNNGS